MRTAIGKTRSFIYLTTTKNSYRIYEDGQIELGRDNDWIIIDEIPKDLMCYFLVNHSNIPKKWHTYE